MHEHNDDFKRIMFTVIGLFLLVVVGWISILFLSACGPHLDCPRERTLNLTVRTPVPSLVPGTLPPQSAHGRPGDFNKCAVKALDLLGAWVSAGSPESDAFAFEDVNGNPCEATFAADVQPLFSQSQVWFPASLSCTSCHNSALQNGGLDLTSYAGVLAGSGRAALEVTHGRNILGAGNWPSSILYEVLLRVENIPTGHPPLGYSAPNLVIFAGMHTAAVDGSVTAIP